MTGEGHLVGCVHLDLVRADPTRHRSLVAALVSHRPGTWVRVYVADLTPDALSYDLPYFLAEATRAGVNLHFEGHTTDVIDSWIRDVREIIYGPTRQAEPRSAARLRAVPPE